MGLIEDRMKSCRERVRELRKEIVALRVRIVENDKAIAGLNEFVRDAESALRVLDSDRANEVEVE